VPVGVCENAGNANSKIPKNRAAPRMNLPARS